MSDRLLGLYHRLPPSLRGVSATLRGAWLRWWRYGPDAERLVAEALEREHWSPERWRAWQEERLAYLLHRAATRVPFYRSQWEGRRRAGERVSWERIEHWPLLHKDALRRHPRAFVADDRSPRRMFAVNTSGTTGTPLRLWRSRAVNREYYALLEARFLRWHGVSWRRPWAVLGGQVVVPPHSQTPPFWVWNAAMHQLYLSANHVSARNASAYASALRRYGVGHLEAYASSAAELARQCVAAGVRPSDLKVVVTNAEPLHPAQREMIRQGLGAPARETYGMVEIVAGGSECEHGKLHAWPDLGYVEVFRDDGEEPVAAGTTGRLVCTGLVNTDMPLIRYVVGDRGHAAESAAGCSCGRTLPVMGHIEGRSNDMLIAPDGRRVYWVNPVFYGLPIHEAQIVQEHLERVRVSYVPASGFAAEHAATVSERLKARLGDVDVVLECVAQIPRGANGKFQAVVSRVRESEPSPLNDGLLV